MFGERKREDRGWRVMPCSVSPCALCYPVLKLELCGNERVQVCAAREVEEDKW